MSYLDRLHDEAQPYKNPKNSVVLDGVEFSVDDDRAAFELASINIAVAAAINTWITTDDLDDGETLADRFDAMMIGICDADKDGEIDDDEMAVLEVAYNAAADFFAQKGVDDADADALINDADADAAERIVELLVNLAPDGEDAELAEINDFGFDAKSDVAAYDAVYKRRVVVRGGKKKIIRKRVSGKVRLSGKQKAAIKKMQRKAHSGAARRARMKSMKRRSALGI